MRSGNIYQKKIRKLKLSKKKNLQNQINSNQNLTKSHSCCNNYHFFCRLILVPSFKQGKLWFTPHITLLLHRAIKVTFSLILNLTMCPIKRKEEWNLNIIDNLLLISNSLSNENTSFWNRKRRHKDEFRIEESSLSNGEYKWTILQILI